MSLVTLITNYIKEENEISNTLSVYILTKHTTPTEAKYVSKISFLLRLVISVRVMLFIPKLWLHFILTDFKVNVIIMVIQVLA